MKKSLSVDSVHCQKQSFLKQVKWESGLGQELRTKSIGYFSGLE
jgi:hypothetical protein